MFTDENKTIEEKLKSLILSRYNSIREFSIATDIPNSTITSIFQRGIGNSSVNNIIKICKALGISVDALSEGKIVPLPKKDYIVSTSEVEFAIEVEEIVDGFKSRLSRYKSLTINGKPANQKSLESIIDAVDVGIEMAKKKV